MLIKLQFILQIKFYLYKKYISRYYSDPAIYALLLAEQEAMYIAMGGMDRGTCTVSLTLSENDL